MKKLFVSLSMKGKSKDEIMAGYKKYREAAERILGEEVDLIHSFIDDAPQGANAIWFLGESLVRMSAADVVYFAPGWEETDGCSIEHEVALRYGLAVIEGSAYITE